MIGQDLFNWDLQVIRLDLRWIGVHKSFGLARTSEQYYIIVIENHDNNNSNTNNNANKGHSATYSKCGSIHSDRVELIAIVVVVGLLLFVCCYATTDTIGRLFHRLQENC